MQTLSKILSQDQKPTKERRAEIQRGLKRLRDELHGARAASRECVDRKSLKECFTKVVMAGLSDLGNLKPGFVNEYQQRMRALSGIFIQHNPARQPRYAAAVVLQQLRTALREWALAFAQWLDGVDLTK